MECRIITIDENTWSIEEGEDVRCFVLAGEKEALLIDGGMQLSNAREIAEGLTALPMKHILTHADRDHTAAIGAFDTFYMHPSEASNFYKTQGLTGNFTPVYEGDVLDLGNRPLKIISIPGHTPGSIGILDVNGRRLFSGDPIQNGMVFLFGVQREPNAYLAGLRHLDRCRSEFDLIYPSHSKMPVKPELIDRLYDALSEILKGTGKYEPQAGQFFDAKVTIYDVGDAKFYMP